MLAGWMGGWVDGYLEPLELHLSLLLLRMKHLICCAACACHNKKSLKCNAPLDFVHPANAPLKSARRTTSLASTVLGGFGFQCFQGLQGSHCPSVSGVFRGIQGCVPGIVVRRAAYPKTGSCVAMPVTMESVCECSEWFACLPVGRKSASISLPNMRTQFVNKRKINNDNNIEMCQLQLAETLARRRSARTSQVSLGLSSR